MVTSPKPSEITAASKVSIIASFYRCTVRHIVLLIQLAGSSTDQAAHSQQDVGLANEQGVWAVVSFITLPLIPYIHRLSSGQTYTTSSSQLHNRIPTLSGSPVSQGIPTLLKATIHSPSTQAHCQPGSGAQGRR